MKIKKCRIISVLLCFLMIAGSVNVFAAYSDITTVDDCYNAVLRLSDLGVISGNPDGGFYPENNLTRAEFAKMIVAALDKEELAGTSGIYTTYTDVPRSHWASGYINYVSSNSLSASDTSKIMVGYSNGNFGPEEHITLAQACTVLMRMLGYEQSDVGYFWPNNYMNAAKSSGLSKGYENMAADYAISRADAAILMDRALFMHVNGSSEQILLGKIGYGVLDDEVVTATSAEVGSPTLNQIKLSDDNIYSYKSEQQISSATVLDYVVLDDDKDIICIRKADEESLASLSAVVTSVTDNQLSYMSTTHGSGSYKVDNSFTCYIDSVKSTFAQVKGQITVGTSITFYGEDEGDWTFMIIDTGKNIKPVIAARDYSETDGSLGSIPINHSGLIVYRDGERASLSDICKNDVVYYNTNTNIMDVYSKKVTGIYSEAYPSKAYVTSVLVAGKTYNLATDVAGKRLDASPGSYEIGDRITLLLGKNDEVVDVVQLTSSEFDISLYGVLISCYTQTAESGINEGNTEYVAELFMADGETRTYTVKKDYSSLTGRLCRLGFEGADMTLTGTAISSERGWGAVNKAERSIGDVSFLKEGSILQINNSEEGSVDVSYIDFETMDVSEIKQTNVISCVTANSFGDIGVLVVENVFVDELYEFGMITGISDRTTQMSNSYTYTILDEESLSASYTVNFKADARVGVPVMYRLSGGRLTDMTRLHSVVQAGSIGALEGGRIKLGSKIYKLSDDVIIYQTKGTKYQCISLSDLQAMKVSGITLYSDRTNGTIRVICVTAAM